MFICNPGANLSMEGNNNRVKLFRGGVEELSGLFEFKKSRKH